MVTAVDGLNNNIDDDDDDDDVGIIMSDVDDIDESGLITTDDCSDVEGDITVFTSCVVTVTASS